LLADFALSEDSELIGRETTPVELTSNVVHGSFNRINMILWHLAARTLSGLFVATVAVAGSHAQGTVADATSKGTPIKSEVQLVLLDVVVTSGNGRPVGGLRKDDFQVAEDGHPQTISFFEEHTGTAPIIVSLPPMPPNVFTNYPTVKKTDSINVFLLDALNTQNLDQAFVRAQMTNYLREAAASPNGARFAIFTLRIAPANDPRVYGRFFDAAGCDERSCVGDGAEGDERAVNAGSHSDRGPDD
jgi:hypothetical protein